MFTIVKKELEWGGRTLSLETGKVARQADGAVMASYGGTTVLCTVVAAKSANPEQDFFPLTVHYQEKAFAAGKIPGGFVKREGRPSEKEVLTSRLIDRPIRPLFPDSFKNEVQIICTVLTHDLENDADIVSIIGASAALKLSGVPFLETLSAARVGLVNNQFTLNPSMEDMKSGFDLDLVVAGTSSGVLMVESEAKELSEDTMLEAVIFAQDSFKPVIDLINTLAEEAGKKAWILEDNSDQDNLAFKAIKDFCEEDLRAAFKLQDKQERSQRLAEIKDQVLEKFVGIPGEEGNDPISFSKIRTLAQMKTLEKTIVRGDLIKTQKRIDGRNPKEVRPIQSEVNVLPKVHGTALFTRGETQAIVTATLGTGQDEQIIDALNGEYRERFMLHYNFPPYSVGEAGRLGSPGRREIGHGKLAWRALNPMIPSKEEFPYTLRVVSEITESNGSSSMATVCGTTLALMDAGVPLKSPVAGIAMGLIKEEEDFVVLTDILGDEDSLGDMDFKVAGTEAGITSLQMDIKVTSITRDIMKTALSQAREGRLHILGEMSKALDLPRRDVKDSAPKIVTIQINTDKIRDLIGPGGKVIREICEKADVKIDISEEGEVSVAANNKVSLDKGLELINNIVFDPQPGFITKGSVSRLMDFGAIVTFMGSRTGLVHISQIVDQRIGKVGDVLTEGQDVFIEILGSDDRGKIKLSMKSVDQETGEKITKKTSPKDASN